MQQLERLQAAGLEPDAIKDERERRQDQDERAESTMRAKRAEEVRYEIPARRRRRWGMPSTTDKLRHDARVKAKARARRKSARSNR